MRGAAPSIIFIMADDLGYADVSCYGRKDYVTPAIDRLAAQGMRFLQAYANSATCSATRTALMTGRYQNRLPIGQEEPLVARGVGLPPEHPTLPSILRDSGYSTVLVGKWHLGRLPRYGPLQSGYERFWGMRGGAVDYFTHRTTAGRPDLWDDDTAIEKDGYLTDLLGERAVRVIEDHDPGAGRPLFLSVHFNAPHWPWEGPGDEATSRRLAAERSRRALFHFDGGSLETYAEIVIRMDLQVGRILEALDRKGMAQDAIVVFTSDNGGERFSDNWPLTGMKSELLEGGLRVPTILRWPGRVAAGAVSEQVIMTMDWAPTLLAAAAARPHPDYPMDGLDLSDALVGGRPTLRTLCWRLRHLDQEACRHGDHKYLQIAGERFLFNLAADPRERANLKDREPETFAALQAIYRGWASQMLPLDPKASAYGYSGRDLADHFGVAAGSD